jgi:hypothetical protein
MVVTVPNYYSSFAFAILPFCTDAPVLRGLLSVFAATSVLHHAKKHESYPGRLCVAVLDRVLCHAIAAMCTMQALGLPWTRETSRWLGLYWACLAYLVAVFYVLRLSYGPHGANWHASVHAASAWGVYCLARASAAATDLPLR